MNYEKDLLIKLEKAGYLVSFWENVYSYSEIDETTPEKAKQLNISNFEEGIIGKVVIVPKVKEVTFDWLMGKIHKEEEFVSLSKYFVKLIDDRGITIYPTSYGIGVFRLFGEVSDRIKQIEDMLNASGITYTNEYSEAGWVYRFKVSKSKENIEKLEKLIEKQSKS